ncbi:putative tricarboxylic transport membrane protein [Bradyrhizobium diazoefficiens]|jgi:putative tricarboxylic transport membrane protein
MRQLISNVRTSLENALMFRFPARLVGAAVALTLAAATPSLAQQLELKLMAPAAPGGGWDQTARSMQQALVAAGVARSVQVTNVPGAGGSVGIAQFVNGAKGDGNQLMVNGFVMVGALAMNKSPVTLEQVTPIARLTEEIQVIVVPANSPIKTAQDLAAAVKADIAKVTFAGGSAGGVDHVMAALFAGADAKKINYIPFSGGGESLAAILGGKVTAGISGMSEYEGQIKSGKLRAIGVTSEKRIAGSDIPTFKEQGIDLVIANWRSVVAPPGITAEQRKTLSDAVEKMVKSDAWKDILKQKGWEDAYLGGDAFADFLKKETVRVTDVLRSVGLVKS